MNISCTVSRGKYYGMHNISYLLRSDLITFYLSPAILISVISAASVLIPWF